MLEKCQRFTYAELRLSPWKNVKAEMRSKGNSGFQRVLLRHLMWLSHTALVRAVRQAFQCFASCARGGTMTPPDDPFVAGGGHVTRSGSELCLLMGWSIYLLVGDLPTLFQGAASS